MGIAILAGVSLAQNGQLRDMEALRELGIKARADRRKLFELLAKGQLREALEHQTTVIEPRLGVGQNSSTRRDLAFELGDFVEADRQNELSRKLIAGISPSERMRTLMDFQQELIRAEKGGYVIDWSRFEETHTEELKAIKLLPGMASVAIKHFRFRFAERALTEYERLVPAIMSRALRAELAERKELQRKIIRDEADIPEGSW
ncbi:MAG: hypothetical protein JNJ45_05775 [Chthonomonas sp.]|nr:hypothetical protein [Chthonomonas sp.]